MQESLDGKTSHTSTGWERWWRSESRVQGQWAGTRQRARPPIHTVLGESVYMCEDNDTGRGGPSVKVRQMGYTSADNTCHATPPAASSETEASVQTCQGMKDNIYKYLTVIKEKQIRIKGQRWVFKWYRKHSVKHPPNGSLTIRYFCSTGIHLKCLWDSG